MLTIHDIEMHSVLREWQTNNYIEMHSALGELQIIHSLHSNAQCPQGTANNS